MENCVPLRAGLVMALSDIHDMENLVKYTLFIIGFQFLYYFPFYFVYTFDLVAEWPVVRLRFKFIVDG